MTAWLRRQGDAVHHKRVARRLHTLGLEPLSPKPRLRASPPAPRVSPYLLRGVPLTRVNHVWRTDITSIRLHGGGLSLVAVMDWCSRYVLLWAVSSTLDVGFCLAALAQALGVARPDIVHSDPGAPFTRIDFTGRLTAAGMQMSMDGRGRALDNGFIERLWRTVQ